MRPPVRDRKKTVVNLLLPKNFKILRHPFCAGPEPFDLLQRFIQSD
jgi:hypothetical protein